MKVRKVDIPMPFTREEIVNSREYKIAGAALNDVSNIDEEYANNEDYIGGYVDGFESGAEWSDEHPKEGLVSIEKACELMVNCIEDFMLRRMEIWDEECKKQTLDNLREALKK